MKKNFDRLGWFLLAVAFLVNCFPRTEEIKHDENHDADIFDQTKIGTRQVAITPTGNGFFKVVGGVPVGGMNAPQGAQVDLGTGDVTNTLPIPRGGTGITTLGSVGQGLCVNGTATGYTFCTFGGSGVGSSVGAIGTVQLTDGSGGFIAATNVIGGVSFLSVGNGSTVANAGQVRVPNNVTAVAADNATHSANITLSATDSSNNAWYGSTPGGTSQPANSRLRAVSNVYIGTQSTDQLRITPGEIDTLQNQNFALYGGQSSATYGNGIGVMYVGNANQLPTTNPSNGGLLYGDIGALRYMSPSGLRTQLDGGVNTISFPVATSHAVTTYEASHSLIWASGHTNTSQLILPAPNGDEDSYVRWIHAGRDVLCSPSGSCLGSMTISMSGGGKTLPLTTDEFTVAVLVLRSVGIVRISSPTQIQ